MNKYINLLAALTIAIWGIVGLIILLVALFANGNIIQALLFGFGAAMISTIVIWSDLFENLEKFAQLDAGYEKAKNNMSNHANQAEDRMNLLWDLMTEEERADMKQRLMSSVKDSDGEISVESLLYNQRQ